MRYSSIPLRLYGKVDCPESVSKSLAVAFVTSQNPTRSILAIGSLIFHIIMILHSYSA